MNNNTDKILPFEIKEDTHNIYIEDYIIPKGMEKEDLKAREKVIWSMYSLWSAKNPEKKCYNHKILVMEMSTNLFEPYFSKIKVTIGVKRSGRKNMYCITAIENNDSNK